MNGSNNFADVGDFHEKFGLPRSDNTIAGNIDDDTPHELTAELYDFRNRFMQEELDEFREAWADGDLAKQADALVDLVYVAMGTAHLMGLPWQALWDEVQRANMSKERAAADGSNSVRKSSFDVVKPAGWMPLDIEGILAKYGYTS